MPSEEGEGCQSELTTEFSRINPLTCTIPGRRTEFNRFVDPAHKRLADAHIESLAPESRFDLAYNAAHGFALTALRQKGYRSENRYVVFQALPHTLGLPAAVWRVLARAHGERNLVEYEGHSEIDGQLLSDLIECASTLEAEVDKLKPPQ